METWLSDCIHDRKILPCGFSLHRKDRVSHGGGVLITVKNYLFSSCLPSPVDLEVISVQISRNQSQLVKCNCYVPPNSGESCLNSLLIYFSDLLSRYDNVIFTGDFNLPDIKWSSLSAHSSSSNAFCDFIFDNNLTQFVDRPTHSGGNVLDLALFTDLEIIDNLLVFQPCESLCSDHFYDLF